MLVTKFHVFSLFYGILVFEYATAYLPRLLQKIFGVFPGPALISNAAINTIVHVQYCMCVRESLGHMLLGMRLLACGTHGQFSLSRRDKCDCLINAPGVPVARDQEGWDEELPLNSGGAVNPPNFPQGHGMPAAVLPDNSLNRWHLKFRLLDTGQIPSVPLILPIYKAILMGFCLWSGAAWSA